MFLDEKEKKIIILEEKQKEYQSLLIKANTIIKKNKILLNEKDSKINEFEKLIENNNNKIFTLQENENNFKILIKEKDNKIEELDNTISNLKNKISELKENIKSNQSLLNERDNKINEFENIIKNYNNVLEENEKIKSLIKEKDNIIREFENKIESIKTKIILFEEKEKQSQSLLKEKDNKINELENIIENNKNTIFNLEENKNKNKKLVNEKDNEIINYKNKILELEENVKQNKLILNEKENQVNEFEIKIKNYILEFEEKEKKNQSLLNEKDNKINEFENIIKNTKNEISKLRKQMYENSENYNYEINKSKEKVNQLEIKIKEYENIIANKSNKKSEKKVFNNQFDNKVNIDYTYDPETKCNDDDNRLFKNDEYNNLGIEQNKKPNGVCDIKNKELDDGFKIYGFINRSSDCYLNSSLQLLTRINELKIGVFNYEKNYTINKDNDTKGQLFIEFKAILNKIENSKNDDLIIDPKPLKNIMGKIDDKYYDNSQEDANEFITYFIDGLLMETSNKLKEKDVKNLKVLKINDKSTRDAYNSFCERFYLERGYSILMDIFYGILQIKKYCKKCGEIISIKFNPYNTIDLPIYQLSKQYKNLELNQILNEFRAEKKYETKSIKCNKCKTSKDLKTITLFYTFPKYLIICFGRTVGNEYIYNNILYDKNLEIRSDYDNKKYYYSLECVLEHSGGVNFGHYSALCPRDKEKNKWYKFSDSSCDKYNNNFYSKNAIILLYKSFK